MVNTKSRISSNINDHSSRNVKDSFVIKINIYSINKTNMCCLKLYNDIFICLIITKYNFVITCLYFNYSAFHTFRQSWFHDSFYQNLLFFSKHNTFCKTNACYIGKKF